MPLELTMGGSHHAPHPALSRRLLPEEKAASAPHPNVPTSQLITVPVQALLDLERKLADRKRGTFRQTVSRYYKSQPA